MENIYLVGMMGSGKTSSGKALAKLLSVRFVDLDEQITEHAGRSINDIFETDGEPHFRKMESDLLLRVSRGKDQVVATGGGIVLSSTNRHEMKNTGRVFYLKTSLEVLWERVRDKRDRPLLSSSNPRKTLEELYLERTPLYETSSEKVFLTDQKLPEEVAQEIYRTCFEKES